MDDDDVTLGTARNRRETALALYKALSLMEDHALESDLDELAFLIGVAGQAAREYVEAAGGSGVPGAGSPPIGGSGTPGDNGPGGDGNDAGDDGAGHGAPDGDPVH
ncbi:MAG: hypothetical protein RID91_23085 [Azospirillaceae bacterium]